MANSWGELGWDIGSWGQQNDASGQPTGSELTLTLSDETATGEINEGWGRLTWGENAWNITGDVLLTGIELTTSLGDESIQIDVASIPTGIELITELNSVTEVITVDTFPIGIELTTTLGTADADPDANVTGIELTTTTGTILGYNREGWGRFYWGEEVWGSNGIWETVSVTGQQLTLTLDSVTAQANADVIITGEILTIAEGEVDPSPDATVTGIGMTCDLAVGTVIIGTADISVTGIDLTITLGTASGEAITLVDVTGIGLTLDLGTAFGGAEVNVDVTGNILTIAQNSISVQSWTKINTGTVVTWTEIDTAA